MLALPFLRRLLSLEPLGEKKKKINIREMAV